MTRRPGRIEFCCLALPLINAGAYTICLEFILVSLCVVILAVAPPQIVATMGALPAGFPKIIVAVLGVIALLWQFVGLFAVKSERTTVYRTYIRVNLIITLVIIVATLAFFAVAAARHSTALDACTAAYGATPAGTSGTTSSALDGLGGKICNVFIWVQVGFMGLLIAVIGLTQLYMCAMQRVYGQAMRGAEQDRKVYNGGGGSNGLGQDEIPLATRGSGVWDAPVTGSDEGHYNAATTAGAQRQSYMSPTRESGGYKYPSYATYGQGGGGGEQRDVAYDDGNAYSHDSEHHRRAGSRHNNAAYYQS